jgi:hypothetical protein
MNTQMTEDTVTLNRYMVGRKVELRNGQRGTLWDYISNDKRSMLKRNYPESAVQHILDSQYPYLILLDDDVLTTGKLTDCISYSVDGRIDITNPDLKELDIIKIY